MVRMPRWTPKPLETLGWLALLPMFGLCLTLWLGYDGRRTIAAFQALTPWVLVWAAPIADRRQRPAAARARSDGYLAAAAPLRTTKAPAGAAALGSAPDP